MITSGNRTHKGRTWIAVHRNCVKSMRYTYTCWGKRPAKILSCFDLPLWRYLVAISLSDAKDFSKFRVHIRNSSRLRYLWNIKAKADYKTRAEFQCLNGRFLPVYYFFYLTRSSLWQLIQTSISIVLFVGTCIYR